MTYVSNFNGDLLASSLANRKQEANLSWRDVERTCAVGGDLEMFATDPDVALPLDDLIRLIAWAAMVWTDVTVVDGEKAADELAYRLLKRKLTLSEAAAKIPIAESELEALRDKRPPSSLVALNFIARWMKVRHVDDLLEPPPWSDEHRRAIQAAGPNRDGSWAAFVRKWYQATGRDTFRNPPEADDFVQDFLEKKFRRVVNRYRTKHKTGSVADLHPDQDHADAASFRGWMRKALRRFCIDLERTRCRQARLMYIDGSEETDWEIASDAESLDESVVTQERRSKIDDILNRVLDDDERVLLKLSMMQGLKYEQIVEKTGWDCKPSTLRQRKLELRKKLRAVLTAGGIEAEMRVA